MKNTKRGIAVVLLISLLFSMNITSVFATDSLVESEPKVYTEGENTLNLEGNFVANGSDGAIWVKNGAQLTINGTDETKVHGTLGTDKYSMAVWAQNKGAKIVINGGYYTNETDESARGTDLIYASNGAEIEINGGKFEAAKPEWTLNCKDKKNTAEVVVLPSTITVKGGTFYKFDPSNANVGEGEIVIPDGYRVAKDGDWYTVYNENTITVEEVEGGTVSATPTKAIVGETVELTATPDEGYELKSLNVITVADSEVKLTDGKFVMPDMGVIVIAEFAKITVEPETPVQPGDNLDYILPGVSEEETEEIKQTINSSIKEKNPELAEDISNALQNGEKVTIGVEIDKLEKDNVKEEEKQMILQTVKENQTVHQYLDISVAVRTEDKLLGNVPELTEKIKVFIDVPENLIKEGRKFFILKAHGDEVERIEAVLNGTKLEFETDQFSTFALAYENKEGEATNGEDIKGEEPNAETPETGDKDETPKTGAINIPAYVWVSIAGIALVGLVTTKKSSKVKPVDTAS